MIRLPPALSFPLLALAVIAIGGCGSAGDAFTAPDPTNQFSTTLSISTSTVTLSGPVASGAVTADAVTVEAYTPGVSPVSAPLPATIANNAWSFVVSDPSGAALTTRQVLIRWYNAGLEIDEKVVTITL